MLDRLLVPDFVGIGAMRSGTGWLSSHIQTHPDIQMARKKELHYFDQVYEGMRHGYPGDGLVARLRYGKWFVRGKTRGMVTGEYTPAYAILPKERIALFRSWMPDVKLIFSMRDPVERSWSHARHRYRRSFNRNWDDDADVSLQEKSDYFHGYGVTTRSDYGHCLENWLSFYPHEQFCFTFLEHIQQDPRAVLRKTLTHIGVDPDRLVDNEAIDQPYDSQGESPIPAALRAQLAEMTRGQTERVRELIGIDPPW